jgi:large subunit ribosomal protein L25
MSDETTISAETRTEFGKGAARRIRRADKVPAVVYGHGNETQHITLPGHDTWLALKHGGANALIRLVIDGQEQLALTKQVQVDPIRRTLEHVDLVAVRKGEKVSVDVPVVVVGDAAADTLVTLEHTEVSIEAEATHIPDAIEVSVAGAEVGTQVLAAQLELPSGSTLLTDPEALVVHVAAAPTEEQVEADLEQAEAEAGIEKDEATEEPAEGSDAAPAGESAEGSSEE